MPFVVIEPQENIMEQLLVTDARDSSEEVFEKNTSTAADSQEIAQWTRIKETNAGKPTIISRHKLINMMIFEDSKL